MKKSTYLRLLAATAGVWLATGALATIRAQNPIDTGPVPQAGPTAVPLDGGASLLLAAGVGLGIRRLRQRRKQAQQAD